MKSQESKFIEISPEEWKLKVQAELAGLDYNEVLVWDTAEGIQVKPLYTAEDRDSSDSNPIMSTSDWKITGNFLNNPEQDTSYLYGLKVNDNNAKEVKSLPEHLDLFFDCNNPFELFSKVDFEEISNLKYLGLDVLGHLAETGNWYKSQEEDLALVKEQLNKEYFEKCIEVDAGLYQNAGANHVQQIALAVLHGVEYLEQLGVEAADKIYFKISVGGNYFFEMAKLRALRKLWNLILKEYNSDAGTMIFAETSMRNKSELDIHNNLIRSSLEAASAIQGKADAVYTYPFDQMRDSDVFSEELAAKQQLLIQKESYFDKFEDPVSGVYFVENLTELMIKNALELFKKIESEGGFLRALFEGSIQKMINKSAEKEQQAFDEGKLILIGVNKFRNPEDKIEQKEILKNEVRTLIQPIFRKRLAEKVETA